ncbi:MAG: peroxide stress protein YaaA [Formosimonas sp.]
MLLVLSPAKSMDFTMPAPLQQSSQPMFVESASELIELLRAFDVPQLAQLMHISDKLAALNVARNLAWLPVFESGQAKPAIFAFKGDVYEGFDAASLTEADVLYAQGVLRSLSGLYGILRPLDLMHAYRLEMGTALANAKGRDLYAFWGTRLAEHLNAELAAHAQPYLINLASEEYFKAVPLKALRHPVIQPVFLDGGKVVSFYAKRARGMMARFAVQHKIEQPELLKNFTAGGYQFCGERVVKNRLQWVFAR